MHGGDWVEGVRVLTMAIQIKILYIYMEYWLILKDNIIKTKSFNFCGIERVESG